MSKRRTGSPVLLVNPNRIRPPVAPIGLEYAAEALRAAGVPAVVLDLAFEAQPEAALRRALAAREYRLVGLSVRNTDDCYLASRTFLLPRVRRLVSRIRAHSGAPVAVGGVGYSVFPRQAWEYLGADYGIAGDGEEALPALCRALEGGGLGAVPGLVWREAGAIRANPMARARLAGLAPARRDLVDNPRYLREGGQVGFETSRGCPMGCAYCADPVAKGRRARLRPPRAVGAELESLAARGVDVFHTCDSEFNVPPAHAAAVCRELIRRRLGERIRWYAYCAPSGFGPELAGLMRRAGCAGVNFGVDSADPGVLARLGRRHGPEEIRAAVAAAKGAGLAVMCDLLVGGPGEDRRTVARTVAAMRRISPHRVGLALGLRIYPGTPLAARLAALPPAGLRLPPGGSLLRPAFFLSPALGPEPGRLLLELVAGDERFFTVGLGDAAADYNYSGHDLLDRAIRAGHRGAFWDILRRLQEGEPPLAPAGIASPGD